MENCKTQLQNHLTTLTAIRPFRNCWQTESLAFAANYIKDQLSSFGLAVSTQQWQARGRAYTNVIGKYNAANPARLIVGAHYDVFHEQPGADDNTSGVAGLLLLSEMVNAQQPDLPYGIDFVFYCLEEPPFFGSKDMGSYQHAKQLLLEKTPVIGMICLDMIGYYSDAPNSQHYPHPSLAKKFGNVGNFITVIGHKKYAAFSDEVYAGIQNNGTIPVEKIDFTTSEGLAGLSDHRNYWYFGFPALMLNDTANYRNPNYHKVTDTVDTLNLDKMSHLIRALFETIVQQIRFEPVIGTSPNEHFNNDGLA